MIAGKSLLERTYNQAKRGGYPTYVLTPDIGVENFAVSRGLKVFPSKPYGRRVDQELLQLAEWAKADAIILVTGDCPLMDPQNIRTVGAQLINRDFAAVLLPKGKEARGVRTLALRAAVDAVNDCGEHGLTYFYTQPPVFNGILLSPHEYSLENFSVDTEEDLLRIEKICYGQESKASI